MLTLLNPSQMAKFNYVSKRRLHLMKIEFRFNYCCDSLKKLAF